MANIHDVQYKGLRYTLAAAGMVASLIFLCGSMLLNYRYGYSLARTEFDGTIYGTLAAASDVLMAASPFFFFAAKGNRDWFKAAAALGLWAATTIFAAQAAVSQASVNRIDAIAARTTVATTYSDTRTELAESRKSRGFIPVNPVCNCIRPEDTVKAELEKHKTSRTWSQTNECSEPSGKAGREFCSIYQGLKAELGYAQQAGKLDARIAILVDKSDKTAGTNAAAQSEADPGAQTISVMTGYDVRTVQGFSIFMVAFLILIGCGLGPYTSWSVMEVKDDRRKALTIEAEPLASAPVEAIKLEPAKPQLLIAKPAEAKPILVPEPMAAEWRAILEELDFFASRKGPLRSPLKREVLGYHWLAWLFATGRTGEYTADQVADLYNEFCSAAHREQGNSINVAKGELREAARKVKKDSIIVRDSKSPTLWTINPIPVGRVREVLIKRNLLRPSPVAAASKTAEVPESRVIPFAGSGAVEPANDDAPEAPRRALGGLAELSRHVPNLEAMRLQARMEKTAMRARGHVLRPQHLHRFSRARAA